MATPDYSKIWSANSPLAKYEFTEADYLRGWEFIGSMPPARTMFDAWMRKADEKMRWLYDNAFSESSLGGFLFWRLPDTAYFVGEKRALQDGPLDVYLECTIAGRTSKEQMKKLPQGAEIGKTFVDGTATWLVRQFATSAALGDHRTKTPLDHPDGSVLKKHLGFDVYDKNEIAQSYRKIGNRIVSGDVDWNTLIEPTTYKIQGVVMDAAHHAPPDEYAYGLLVVNRLENGADDEWRTVQIYLPRSTRGYWSRMYNGSTDYLAKNWLEWRYIPTHNEVETIAEQKASTKVSKNGDTISGRIVFEHDPSNKSLVRSVLPAHYYHNYWKEEDKTVYVHAYLPDVPTCETKYCIRVGTGEKEKFQPYIFTSNGLDLGNNSVWTKAGVDGIFHSEKDNGDAVQNGGSNINISSWFGLGFYSSFSGRYTGAMDLRAGNWRTIGFINASTFYANSWFRAYGDSGFYFEDHGGGWHMTDNIWIRTFGGKKVYCDNVIRADGGFEGNLRGTADNANTIGDKSLGWILEQINVSKTQVSILTGAIAHGGTIPLPSGYNESQCRWIVSNRSHQIDDDDTFSVSADNRVVHCWTGQRGGGWANYMIIGVK